MVSNDNFFAFDEDFIKLVPKYCGDKVHYVMSRIKEKRADNVDWIFRNSYMKISKELLSEAYRIGGIRGVAIAIVRQLKLNKICRIYLDKYGKRFEENKDRYFQIKKKQVTLSK